MTNLHLQPLFSELQQHPSSVYNSCAILSPPLSPPSVPPLFHHLLHLQAASAKSILTAGSTLAAVVAEVLDTA